MKPTRFFLFLVSGALAASVAAQEVPVVAMFKSAVHRQNDPVEVTTLGYAFVAAVTLPSGASAVVTMQKPNGSETLQRDGSLYIAGREYLTRTALDAAYPSGIYTVRVDSAGRTGQYPINMTADLPAAPRILNYNAAQTIPNGTAFTLEWAPFPNGTVRDMIVVEIQAEDGSYVFETPGLGEPGALSGERTSLTISLPASKRYRATLTFLKLSQGDARFVDAQAPFAAGAFAVSEFSMRTVVLESVPTITRAPASQAVSAGARVVFDYEVTPAGGAYMVQWFKDGLPIPGATGQQLLIANAQPADMGFYSVGVWTGKGVVTQSTPAVLTVASGGDSRLKNISSRAVVPAGGDLIPGFVVRGGGAKSLLLRAIGPQLTAFGVTGAMADPSLELRRLGATQTMLTNDDWGGGDSLKSMFAAQGAFPLSDDLKSAACVAALSVEGTEAYTVRVRGGTGGGAALAEVYDCDSADSVGRIVNLSTRATISGSSSLICGFVIDGAEPKRVLIRGVGPKLAEYGVTDALPNPSLTVVPLGKSITIAQNDDWGGGAELSNAFSAVGAFGLSSGSKDAALVLWLPPGGYTVQLTSADSGTGTALFEVYDLTP